MKERLTITPDRLKDAIATAENGIKSGHTDMLFNVSDENGDAVPVYVDLRQEG